MALRSKTALPQAAVVSGGFPAPGGLSVNRRCPGLRAEKRSGDQQPSGPESTYPRVTVLGKSLRPSDAQLTRGNRSGNQ